MATLLMRIKRKKWILLSDGGWIQPESFVKKAIKKFFIRKAAAYLVSGTAAKEHLEHYGARTKRIFNAYFTCDVEHFQSASSLGEKECQQVCDSLELKKVVFLYVGQFIKRKGLINLLQAYRKLEREGLETSLLLVGSGPLRSELERQVLQQELGSVRFAGFVRAEDLPKYYGLADIFVFPSLNDIWGLVVNEAMASGLPVIATDKVGAAKDLVEEGVNGFIVRAGDTEALYKRMRVLGTSPRLRGFFGEKSREIISRWTNKEAVDGFLQAIEYAVHDGGEGICE
jgi:glycosyltransferase involved in cell wall biosynthesis